MKQLIKLSIILLHLSIYVYADDKNIEQRVVAEINGTKITKSQLDSELESNLKDEIDSFKEEQKHELLKTMLQKIVERTLLLQKAKSSGFLPNKTKVKKFVTSINSKLPEKKSFESQLKSLGVEKKEYIARLQEELAIKEYLDKKIFKDLNVTKEQLHAYFIENSEDYASPKQVCARHIFIRVPEKASELVVSEKKKKAAKVRQMAIDKTKDFAIIARRFSEASNSAKGGDLGCFTENQLPRVFSSKAFSLKPKEISEIVKTPEGFHIIKVNRFKGGETPELSDVEKRVEKRILRLKREALLKEHLELLTKEGKVIIYYR